MCEVFAVTYSYREDKLHIVEPSGRGNECSFSLVAVKLYLFKQIHCFVYCGRSSLMSTCALNLNLVWCSRTPTCSERRGGLVQPHTHMLRVEKWSGAAAHPHAQSGEVVWCSRTPTCSEWRGGLVQPHTHMLRAERWSGETLCVAIMLDFIQTVWIFYPKILCLDFINKCLDFSSLENCLTFPAYHTMY